MTAWSKTLEPRIDPQFRGRLGEFLSGKRPTYATVLLSGLLRQYGAEVMNWDSTTIELEVKRDFLVDMPRETFDQLMGLLSALTTDAVYWDVAVFDQTVNALNRASVQHAQDAPTVLEVAWTVTELGLTDPEPHGRDAQQPFASTIRAYIGVVLRQDGYLVAPTCLKFAEATVDSGWADDPDMHAGIYSAHADGAKAVDQDVQQRLMELLDHLEWLGIEIPKA